MRLTFGPLPNGTDAALTASDLTVGRHTLSLRSLPSGGFLGQQPDERVVTTDDAEDWQVVRFDGSWPEAIGVRAYDSVDCVVEFGKSVAVKAPKTDEPEKPKKGKG